MRVRMTKRHGKRRASGPAPAGPKQAAREPHGAAAVAPEPAPGPPPAYRDPWAWLVLLSVLPLVWHSLGAPLGEPVAEDFDFLHRALLSGNHSLLDGGGSMAFWRPVAHQLYYLALGPLMLAHPGAVAAIHAALMAIAALLIYLALRPAWSGLAAAVAASFPLFSESTRTLLSWPSHFVDLGLWLFTAVALFAASRGWLALTLIGLALALGCKELAVAAALMIPWLPGIAARGGRRRWLIATYALAIVWGAAYLAVRRAAHLELPHNLEHNAQILATPIPQKLWWGTWNSLRAIMSLPLTATPHDGMFALALEALGLVFAVAMVVRRGAIPRLAGRAADPRARGAWTIWGLAWFALASASLAAIYPMWQPNRSAYGAIGLGIALAALLEAAQPLLPAALFALRLGMFATSPGPPATVTAKAPQTGAFMDFDHLVRLQRLMRGVRERLTRDYPTLPHGVQVCQTNMPLLAEYAFGRSFALQAWYRDTTVHWLRYEDFKRDTSLHPVTVVQYEPEHEPMVALVNPRAMRLVEATTQPILKAQWPQALALLTEADSIQKDRGAGAFFSILGTREAIVLSALNRHPEAEAVARMALAQWPGSPNARYWIGFALAQQKRWAESEAVLDTALAIAPGDTLSRQLRASVRASRIAAGK